MKAHIKRKTPGAEAVKRKHEPKTEAAPTFQRPQPTNAEIKAYSLKIGAVHKRIALARPARFNAPEDWKAWTEAVRQKYEIYKKHSTLYAQHFSREIIPEDVALYDWDFWRDMELLRGGDKKQVEKAIAFLAADPWFHGSGYAKEDLIPAIRRCDLSPQQEARLQTVVLNMVDRRHGREFRAYCSLARKVDSPELREGLTRRLTHDDPNIRRRAQWVLEALESAGGKKP